MMALGYRSLSLLANIVYMIVLGPLLVFLGGLVVIVAGAELVLRSAKRFAALLGVRPIIIGLTVVSVGTTAPEFAVGVTAASSDSGTLAVGNIIGTNIFNLACILGLSAILRPLPLFSLGLRFDISVLILATVVLMVMSFDGALGAIEGLLLLAGALIYTLAVIRLSRKESSALRREYAAQFGMPPNSRAAALRRRLGDKGLKLATFAALAIGIGVTLLGAQFLVSGATGLAREFGVSDVMIGLTIVAIGTSAPELATTAVATLRDEQDIAVGNLVGSSLYNILVILAVTTLFAESEIPIARELIWIDMGMALAVTFACLLAFRSQRNVTRLEGIGMLLAYCIYLGAMLAWRM